MGWKFKIVERGGRTLKELLTKANIFDKESCGRAGCISCKMGKKPQNCRRRGLMYETACMECCNEDGSPRAKYVGESARSISERYNEHVVGGEKGLKDSHMNKH